MPSALSGFDARASCVLVGCEDGRVAVLSVRNNVVAAEAVAAAARGHGDYASVWRCSRASSRWWCLREWTGA